MNCGYNYSGCGCNSYAPNFACNPFGCGGCNNNTGFGCGYSMNSGCGGTNWFAIVLVVFLLLIICGCTRIHS